MMTEYGVSALVLGTTPCELPRFFRTGGEDAPTTDVGAAVMNNGDEELIVSIGFPDDNPRYQPVSRGEGLANPAYQHSVAVLIRPSWAATTIYYFAQASNGEHFGLRYESVPLPDGAKPEPVVGYWTRQDRLDGDCLNAFIIPWEVIGGKPDGPFGLNVLYNRAQSSEYLCPVALDHTREIAPDLFMEVTCGDVSQVIVLEGNFVTLPSGVQRWQRPAVLAWPSDDERRAIWALQQELHTPTTSETLSSRVQLCQRWLDLLVLEGFSFHPQGGSWFPAKGEYQPEQARMAVNEALRRGDVAEACRVLEAFLVQLDRASRAWFADGSPGDIRPDWALLDAITEISCSGTEIVLTGNAVGNAVTLYLSAPQPGCLRLHASATGFFDAPPNLPVIAAEVPGGVDAHIGTLHVAIRMHPWSITVKENKRIRWRLAQGDVAFLFQGEEVAAISLNSALAQDEAIYGFGERFDAVNQRGRVITVHDLDAWEGTIFGLRNHQYKPIQLFHSTAGYSLFLNSTGRLRADVGQGSPDRLRLTQVGPVFDLYLWACDPLDALKGYTDLTGKPVLPPKWAFEPWMGGGHGRWKNGPLHNPTAEMLDVAEKFAALDIPHAAIYAEGEGSSDPRLFAGLAPRGIRPLTWMNSHMALKLQQELLPGVPEDELPIIRREDGRVFPYVDFTHPRAMDLLRAYWQRYLDLGIAGTMVDFGDLLPDDATFHDSRRGPLLHNLYAYEYHRLYRQVFEERRGDDHILFSRSAAPGSQRWLGQFAGDHQPNFVGMTAALYGGLNLSACGFSAWGCDIGGYMGWSDPETYIRWVQWGCFSPIMRCHGTEPREPWEFGDEAVRIYAFYAWLRENLLDYLYTAAVEAHETGIPMMRALPLAFPNDPTVADCGDEYLLGPDLLVAPVLTGALSRIVRIPTGRWTDFWSGDIIDGPAALEVDAPLDCIPLYLRAGARMPVHLNGALQWGASMTGDRVAAVVATPPGDGDFTLKVDGVGVRYLLLYGTIAAVTVNGRELPHLTGDDIAACPPGWFVDGTRTIIRLPDGGQRVVTLTVAERMTHE